MTPNDLKQEMREHGCGKQLDDLIGFTSNQPPKPREASPTSPNSEGE
jgi:hypothetical protein